jgi:hypothetical protein
MSLDAKYIVQYEGPFPEKYLENKSKEYGHYFSVWGYDTIIGETNHSPDDEIINIAKSHGDAIQILRRLDDSCWEEIYRIHKEYHGKPRP